MWCSCTEHLPMSTKRSRDYEASSVPGRSRARGAYRGVSVRPAVPLIRRQVELEQVAERSVQVKSWRTQEEVKGAEVAGINESPLWRVRALSPPNM